MRVTYKDYVEWRKLLDATCDFARRAEREQDDPDLDRALRHGLSNPPADVFAEFGHTTQQFGRAFLSTARALAADGSPRGVARPAYAGALLAVAKALDLQLERHLISLSAHRTGEVD